MNSNITRDYEQAIDEIFKAYYFINNYNELNLLDNNDNVNMVHNKQYPYFFIVGAGICAKTVKTAKQIISECKNICGYSKENLKDIEENEYLYWLKKAFPHKETRRRYLETLVKDKKIPEEVTKLANILQSRKITNLVITPNFDDFIYESLKLFGENNILLADSYESVEKLNLESSYLNILHTYGSYEFYDCSSIQSLYDDAETKNPLFSVKSFIRTALNRMSPIVIGYSGWENDIIMYELKERLKTPLKYKIYWFCYSDKDYENLAAWIKYSDVEKKIIREDVIFVLPKLNSSEFFRGQEKLNRVKYDEELGAREILSSFIKKFDIKSPEIIKNPLKFLENYYKENLAENFYTQLLLLSFHDSESSEKLVSIKEAVINKDTDKLFKLIDSVADNIHMYDEKSIKELLGYLVLIIEECKSIGIEKNELKKIVIIYKRLYRSIEQTSDDRDKLGYIKIQLNEINDMYYTSDAKDIIDSLYEEINKISEYTNGYKELFRKCINMKLAYSENNTEGLYDEIIDKIKNSKDIEDKKLLITLYMEKGLLLENKNNFEAAIDMFENAEKYLYVLKECEWAENMMITCRMRKADVFDKMNDYSNALIEIETIENRYYGNDDSRTKNVILNAMLLKGCMLKKNMNFEEAEAVFDEIYIKYGSETDNDIKRIAAKAILCKAETLEADESFYEAVEVYNAIYSKYKNDKDDDIRRIAAQAALNKLVILTKSEKDEVIIKKCDEIINTYKEEADSKIGLIVLQVILCKAIGLHNSGRQKEAMEIYNEIIKMRREDADIKMKSLVLEAKIFKSYCLKKEDKIEDTKDAKEMCNEMISLYKDNEDSESKEKVIDTMLKQADLLIKTGEFEEGIKTYNEIEATYKDNIQIVRNIRESIQKMAKDNIEAAKTIYEQLKYNCGNSGYAVQDEILIAGFCILINEKQGDFNLIEDNARSLSTRNDYIKKIIENIVGSTGTDAYINKNFTLAEKYYSLLYKINNDMGLNLAYMIRRDEVYDAYNYPDCEVLIDTAVNNKNDFGYLNKALMLIDKNEYDEAVYYVRKVNNPNVFDWWKHMDESEVEKYVVLFMGLITGKIKDEQLNINDVIEKLESLDKKDLILQVERLIYLEK